MSKQLDLKQIERIEHFGRWAARYYALENPGEKLSDSWLKSAYESDACGETWPETAYSEIYEVAARETFASEELLYAPRP